MSHQRRTFEIAENPQPGHYRYLQFAWKSLSTTTTGMALLLGRPWPGGGVQVSVGDATFPDYSIVGAHTVPGAPASGWTKVAVDLWAVTNGKPPRIQCLSLKATGGSALFDQLILARTQADLP